MRSLTKRQREILEYIVHSITTTDRFPSYREIGRRFNLRSPATVSQHLEALVRKGFLNRVGKHLMLSPQARATRGIPIVGRVAAGLPIAAIENHEGYIDVASLAEGDATHFAVRVRGDSMKEAGILDGDYVIVRQQQSFKDGDIVVAYIGDDPEATVKVIRKHHSFVELQPRGEGYESLRLRPGKDLFRIGGKVVGLVRKLR